MEFDPADLEPRDAYRMLIACVVPRPIAWISTLSPDGHGNLAPFSFFGGVTSAPWTVMMSVGRRRGAHKDTSANLLADGPAGGEGVIHIGTRSLGASLVATSADLPPEEDEFDAASLERAPSKVVRPPRVAAAPIAMEARVAHHMEVGTAPVDLFLMEVVHVHVDDRVVRDGLPDPAVMEALGRLGGASYCDTSAPFDLPRP